MPPIRAFLADDHEIVRLALRTLLEDESDIVVVGEAANGAEAVAGVAATRPDVLVLDLHMPQTDGVVVCQRVKEDSPETSVLVLTSFDQDEDLFGALNAGASGYLLKETRPDRVVTAIRAVADGQAVFDSQVAARVIGGAPEGPQFPPGIEPLSEREMEVLELMAKGCSNREIGQSLWIGEATVKTHVSHILRKLGQADRTKAVVTAVQTGLIRLQR